MMLNQCWCELVAITYCVQLIVQHDWFGGWGKHFWPWLYYMKNELWKLPLHRFVQWPLTRNLGDHTAKKRISGVCTDVVTQVLCFPVAGSSFATHTAELAPSVRDLAELERQAQTSFLNFKCKNWTQVRWQSEPNGARWPGKDAWQQEVWNALGITVCGTDGTRILLCFCREMECSVTMDNKH